MNEETNVEKIYQKKTQLEHILLRPDSYVGSIEATSAQLWILPDPEDKFVQKTIDYVPGLYKIFDEILVNAADNYQRDNSMDTIKVSLDKTKHQITIWNNGKGIPVQIHKEYKIYVPELIFGHLLTSSNYDDSKKKITGGRNGYGAKLTNIFSKKFTVETADSKTKKKFKMVWENNMSINSPPEIADFDGEDFTCVTFKPDLKRFGMKDLDEDTIALMKKRVWDLAGVISSTVKVYWNNKKIPVKGFSQYAEMYLKNSEIPETLKLNDKSTKGGRWHLIISHSEGQFQQVSFVNSICTSRGGTHVNYVVDQITEKLLETIKKKHKDLNLKPFQIKNHLWIFLNCQIVNPAFDSQTKETLTTKPAQFGSTYELSDKFMKEILKSGIVEMIIANAQAKQHAKMTKTLHAGKKSRFLGIPKLEDANDAGTKNAESCTLILTEGDSAKQLAMAGIEVVGRDKYGVFPLKGKFLNVRDASIKQITDNQEIQHLIKILGLQVGKKYDSVKQLRYGSIMIMADQDHDGSHIKGLIINFFHHFWPSLVHQNGFLKEFVTPLIKAKKNSDIKSFFTIGDFKGWCQSIDLKKWTIKYYKGLGTSTDKEGKEYFSNINKHQIFFKYQNDEDDEAIDLAFNKKKADNRKEWLQAYHPDNYVDHNIKNLRYKDFVNKELIQFSFYDNTRSIPSMCDGLKTGQRKILYACFKRNLKAEIKVAQLVGYVAEHSAYHHGEASLAQTIVGMAQNFVGSNNINLLMPIGQFGSRNMGGKEAASPRYIYTNLNKITRILFNEHDDHLYNYLEDDGQIVEPEWYLPIIPLVLVNGAEGIGTGWSTFIPCYSPIDLIMNIKSKLYGNEMTPMKPWFRGFEGTIEITSKGGFICNGKFEVIDESTLKITEIPIRKWTREYKNFLETMLNPDEGEADIEDIKEYHTNNSIDFVIKFHPGKLDAILKGEGIEKKFKLSGSVNASNLVLFDAQGVLKKYGDTREILEEYITLRLELYNKRKEYLISKAVRDLEILENKKRFVLAVISDDIKFKNIKKNALLKELFAKGYKKMRDMPKIKSTKINSNLVEDETVNTDLIEDEESSEIKSSDYNYLLSIPLWNLTSEKVDDLISEHKKKTEELQRLTKLSPIEMYETDLEEFLEAYHQEEESFKQEIIAAKSKVRVNSTISKSKTTKKAAAKKKVAKKKNMSESEPGESEEEPEISDDDMFSPEKKKRSVKKTTSELKELKTSLSMTDIQESEKKPEKDKSFPSFFSQDNEKAKNLFSYRSKRTTTSSQAKTPIIATQSQEEAPDKKDFKDSILKFLIKKPHDSQQTEIIEDNTDKPLSLTERLRLRESKGEIQSFNEMYNTIKKTPSKSLIELLSHSNSISDHGFEDMNGKRKAESPIERELYKKNKGEEAQLMDTTPDKTSDDKMFSSIEDSDDNSKVHQSVPDAPLSTSEVHTRRSDKKRVLIISDDEEEKSDEEYLF